MASKIGVKRLQGPHQGAQKSMKTNSLPSMVSFAFVAVMSITFAAMENLLGACWTTNSHSPKRKESVMFRIEKFLTPDVSPPDSRPGRVNPIRKVCGTYGEFIKFCSSYWRSWRLAARRLRVPLFH